MGKRRRTEIAEIADPAKRLVTYSKRRKGLFKKASELCALCGARVAVIVFSPAGKLCSFGDPSAEEVISEYVRGGSGVEPPMGLAEWLEWIEKEWESSATEEDVESLIAKYEAARDLVRNRLEDLEKNSSVNIGDADSGTWVGCNSENLSDQEIDLVLEGFKARCPALFEDCLCNGDGHAFLPSSEKSAAAGGSLGVDFAPTLSDLERCEFNPDNFLNLFGDCVGDADRDNFLPDNSAIGDGISGDESMLFSLEKCTFDLDEFLSLFKNCGGDGFLTFPDNSAIGSGGGNSGEEFMVCDLHECGFNPVEFLCLEEDFVSEANRDNFSTLPENSAIGEEILRTGYDPDHFLTLEDLDIPL